MCLLYFVYIFLVLTVSYFFPYILRNEDHCSSMLCKFVQNELGNKAVAFIRLHSGCDCLTAHLQKINIFDSEESKICEQPEHKNEEKLPYYIAESYNHF